MAEVVRTRWTATTTHTLDHDQKKNSITEKERVVVRSSVADRMGAWHLLDFADALRAAGGDQVKRVGLTAHRSDAGHLTGLTAEWEYGTDQAEPAPDAGEDDHHG